MEQLINLLVGYKNNSILVHESLQVFLVRYVVFYFLTFQCLVCNTNLPMNHSNISRLTDFHFKDLISHYEKVAVNLQLVIEC